MTCVECITRIEERSEELPESSAKPKTISSSVEQRADQYDILRILFDRKTYIPFNT